MLSGLLIVFLHPAVFHLLFRVQVFQGLGYSESRIFRFYVFRGTGFSWSRFIRVQGFQNPGFSGSRSRVLVRSPGPSFRSSPLIALNMKWVPCLNASSKVTFRRKQKKTVLESYFNKLSGWRLETLFEKRLRRFFFSFFFVKFFCKCLEFSK